MSTEPMNGRVVLTDFTHKGGKPADPQPKALDPATHNGVVLQSADGKSEQCWHPQVEATPPAPTPIAVDPLTFLRMFTNDERAKARLSTEPAIIGMWPLFDRAVTISVLDDDIQAAFAIFVALGIVTSERVKEIVDNWPTT